MEEVLSPSIASNAAEDGAVSESGTTLRLSPNLYPRDSQACGSPEWEVVDESQESAALPGPNSTQDASFFLPQEPITVPSETLDPSTADRTGLLKMILFTLRESCSIQRDMVHELRSLQAIMSRDSRSRSPVRATDR